MSEISTSDVDIIARCASGALVLDIDRFDRAQVDENSLVSKCIALHNQRRINLLSLIDRPQFLNLDGHRFFVLQHFFCETIPLLESPTDQMLRTVEVLVEKGGSDLAAGMPNDALRSWLAKDTERAKQVVDMANAGDECAARSLTFAVEALGDIELARASIVQFSDKRRLSGMSALGRLKSPDASQAETSVNLLLPYVKAQYDDETRCNALIALFKVCEHFSPLFAKCIPAVIEAAIESGTDATSFALARTLWLFPKMFDHASLKSALDSLTSIEASKTGTIHDLDYGLASLLDTPHRGLALDFVEAVLSRNNPLDLDQFKSTKQKLADEDRSKMLAVMVRWLMNGKHRVGESAAMLLRTGEKEKPFDGTTEGLDLSASGHITLAHRAIGYLLITNPVATASILVACLRGCSKDIGPQIGELLFDPILVNYGGSARDYLRTIKRGDHAYKQVRASLKQCDLHFDGLNTKAPVKELHPSDYQRSVERIRRREMVRQVHKDADKQSIFANLVHRSTLLHGRRSMTFVAGPDDELRPVVMDLHSFGTSFEIPRMEIVDPVGLNLMLVACRSMGSRR